MSTEPFDSLSDGTELPILDKTPTGTCCDSVTAHSVERVAIANLPTEWGDFQIAGYRSLVSDEEFVVLFKGEMRREIPTLVRIHSQCLTGDVFGSIKCDCGEQLHQTMRMIQEEGRGAIVYQQQEGRASASSIRYALTPCKIREQTLLRLMKGWVWQST